MKNMYFLGEVLKVLPESVSYDFTLRPQRALKQINCKLIFPKVYLKRYVCVWEFPQDIQLKAI